MHASFTRWSMIPALLLAGAMPADARA